MGKFEDVWTLLLPDAEELRARGTKPQDICMRLAILGFGGDKTKYNTVKGWYKRHFRDWPEDGEDMHHMGSRRRYSDIHPQIEAYHLLPVPDSDESQMQSYESQDYLPRQELDFPQQQSFEAPTREDNGSAQQWTQQAASYELPLQRHLHNSHWKSQHPSGPSSRYAIQHSEAEESNARSLSRHGILSQHPYVISGGPDQQSSVNGAGPLNMHVGAQPNPDTLPQRTLRVGNEEQYLRHNTSQHSGISFNNVVYNQPQNRPLDVDVKSPAAIHNGSPEPGEFVNFLWNTDLPDIGGDDDMHGQLAGNEMLLNQSTTSLGGPLLASNSYSISPSQLNSETRTPQLAQAPLDTGHGAVSTVTPYEIEQNSINQAKSVRRSTKHHRVSSTFPDPTLPPQFSLPPDPPCVVRRRADQTIPTPWEPVKIAGSKIVALDPEEYPTDHPRKLVKRQLGSENRDSIGIYHDQSEGPNNVRRSSTTKSTASTTSRKPLSDQPVNPSNASTRSSIRDSGYISSVESQLRDSFTSFKLTDDPTFKMNHTESDDGYVELKFKMKWRVRRSYIERLDGFPGQF